jgi:hypothetical protein
MARYEEGARLLASAEEFCREFAPWVGAQVEADPTVLYGSSRYPDDGDAAAHRQRVERAQKTGTAGVHNKELAAEYEERFADRAVGLHDAFTAYGIKPRLSRAAFQYGTLTIVVRSVLGEIERLTAELRTRANP